jgi:hypothetical protein
MKMPITTLSLGLLFTVAYAVPLPSPQLRLTPSEVDSMPAHELLSCASAARMHVAGQAHDQEEKAGGREDPAEDI